MLTLPLFGYSRRQNDKKCHLQIYSVEHWGKLLRRGQLSGVRKRVVVEVTRETYTSANSGGWLLWSLQIPNNKGLQIMKKKTKQLLPAIKLVHFLTLLTDLIPVGEGGVILDIFCFFP